LGKPNLAIRTLHIKTFQAASEWIYLGYLQTQI